MPFYPEEVIQQLKSQADISLVIQQFLPLKRSGTNRYVGVCPFHDDHSPSMTVNPTLGIYKCFACGAGGDVFKFVQEHEKIDFNGAVEWVANFVGFSLPKFASKENAEVQEEKGMIRKLNELACNWFEQQLSLSEKALEYLAKRNISEQTRKQFHIGYAPDKREGLIAYAAKNGFSPKDCLRAGLAVEKKNGGIDDKFRDRLMIAIQNQSGTVVAFGGRDLAPKQEGFERPKYMNSPETPLYNKSEILFGLNHSRTAIAKENAVIIVEGYFDLISLYQGGVQNVVAASGTALTEFHANILARYAKTAYLVFDGDAAGRKATHRTIEIVLPKGIVPRIFALSRPDGTKIDPDNFVNEQGAEAFHEQLKGAEDWLSYLSRNSDLQSIESRASFVTYAKSIVKSIQDKGTQEPVREAHRRTFRHDALAGRASRAIRPQKAPKAAAPQPQPRYPEFAEYGEVPPVRRTRTRPVGNPLAGRDPVRKPAREQPHPDGPRLRIFRRRTRRQWNPVLRIRAHRRVREHHHCKLHRNGLLFTPDTVRTTTSAASAVHGEPARRIVDAPERNH